MRAARRGVGPRPACTPACSCGASPVGGRKKTCRGVGVPGRGRGYTCAVMIQLKINQQPVDLPPEGAGLRIDFTQRAQQEFASPRGDASYTIRLPTTRQNRRILGPLAALNLPLSRLRDAPPNPQGLLPAQLTQGGDLLLQGFVRLLSASPTAYELQLLGGNASWGKLLEDRRLPEVDLNAGGWREERWWRNFTICDFFQTLEHTGKYVPGSSPPANPEEAFQLACYPFFVYNDESYANLATTPLPLERLRPATFIGPLLHAHFEEIGYRLESEWLNALAEPDERGEVPGPLILPFAQEEWRISNQLDEDEVQVGARLATDDPAINKLENVVDWDTPTVDLFSELQPFTFNDTTPGTQGIGSGTVLTWRPQRPGRYSLRCRLQLQVLGGGALSGVGVGMYTDQGNVLQNYYAQTLGNVTFVEFDAEFDVRAEHIRPDAAVLFLVLGSAGDVFAEAESWFSIRQVNTVLEGSRYDLRATLPPLTVLELLKDLSAMFDLHFQTDPLRKRVQMEPREWFRQREGLELSPHVLRNEPPAWELFSARYPRRLTWEYPEMNPDEALNALQPPEQTEALPYAAGQLQNPNNATTGRERTELRHLHPVAMEWEPTFGLNLPTVRFSDFPNFRTNIGVRIAAKRVGTALLPVPLTYTAPVDDCNAIAYTSGQTETERYPQAWFQLVGRTLQFGPTATAPGLLELFYRTWFAQLAESRTGSLQLVPNRLPLKLLLNFRQSFLHDGQLLAPEALKNYRPEEPAPLELQVQHLAPFATRIRWLHQPRYALRLPGNGAYARTPNPLPTDWIDQQDVVLSMWLRPAALPALPTVEWGLLRWRDTATNVGFTLALLLNGRVRWRMEDSQGRRNSFEVNTPLVPGQWAHLMLHRRGDDVDQYRGWVNGKRSSANNLQNQKTKHLGGHSSPLELGRLNSTPANDYQGDIGQVLVFRRAPTPWEAAWLWNNGRGNVPENRDALLLWLPNDQPEGNLSRSYYANQPTLELTGLPPASTQAGGGVWVPFAED